MPAASMGHRGISSFGRWARATAIIGIAAFALGSIATNPSPAATPGNALSWGGNLYGALGRSTPTGFSPTPGPITGLPEVIQVSAGGHHSLALRADGTVLAWGDNQSGQIGDGTRKKRPTAVQVRTTGNRPLTGIKQVAAGWVHSLALAADGRVFVWGDNTFGQLGDGRQPTARLLATPLPIEDIVQVSAGRGHSLAVQSMGEGTSRVLSWGSDQYGQLGRSSTLPNDEPGSVAGSTGFIAVAAGGYHSLAIKNDRRGYGWGRNTFGQVGDGTTTDRASPTLISKGAIRFKAIAAGGHHSLAVLTGRDSVEDLVAAWGFNFSGQLGDGSRDQRTTPVQTRLDAKIAQVDAGPFHSVARAQNGNVYAWGDNPSGALGDGTTTMRISPVKVPSLLTQDVSAGGEIDVEDPCEDECFTLAIAKRPTLRLDPPIGPPGFVTTAIGQGFPENATVELTWNKGIGRVIVKAGPAGTFRVPVLIFHHDLIGPRILQAAKYGARANFLVVPAQIQPRRFVTRS